MRILFIGLAGLLLLTTLPASAACGPVCQKKCKEGHKRAGLTYEGCVHQYSYWNCLRGDPGFKGKKMPCVR